MLRELDRLNVIFAGLNKGLLADEIEVLLRREESRTKHASRVRRVPFYKTTDAAWKVAHVLAAIPGVRRIQEREGYVQTSGGFFEAKVSLPGASRWNVRIDVRSKDALYQLQRRTARKEGLTKEEVRGYFARQGIVLLSTVASVPTIVASFQEQMHDIHLANMLLGRTIG